MFWKRWGSYSWFEEGASFAVTEQRGEGREGPVEHGVPWARVRTSYFSYLHLKKWFLSPMAVTGHRGL